MTEKTKVVGYDSGQGKGSSAYLSPRQPQTGDGRTSRNIFDKVKVVFRKGK